MEVYDAVRSRLTVREYKPDPVPDDVVMKLLEAAGSRRVHRTFSLVIS